MIFTHGTNKEAIKKEYMLSYEIHGYISIKSVIQYMTNNIYHLHMPLYMIALHYVI